MQRRAIVPAILVLGLTWSITAYSGAYEMKDLEALEKQGSWQEALVHLDDIPPSKRNDAWNRIAEKSAGGVLAAIDPSKEETGRGWGGSDLAPPRALHLADEILKQYPSLGKSKVFMQARADSALKGFKVTYANSSHNQGDDPWRDQLKAFVLTDTTTPDLALRAGKLVTSRLVAYVAIPFFKMAINGSSGAGACKDADVKKALVSALAESNWLDDAKALVDKSCFGDVRGALEAELAKTPANDKLKANACPIFAAHKASIAACK
jgi:hypothetical protein